MGLAAPWFLAGLAAVALPVYFHLLKKHRSTPLPFSSLMFFRAPHAEFDPAPPAAISASVLTAHAAAGAVGPGIRGPFIYGGPAGAEGGGGLAVLAIDNSFSMRQGSRLDDAKRQAVEVIAGLGPDRKAQVLSFARTVSLMSEATDDQAALRGAVAAIRPTDSRGSYGDLATALRSLAQSSQAPLEVHLFSDLQKTSMPAGFAELALPPGASLKIHAAGGKAQPNWAVESVSAPARVDDQGKVRAQATIAGYLTDAAARRVSVAVNGRVVETKEVNVPAGGRATVEFGAFDVPHGNNRCEVRLEGGDAFSEDDRFRFAVEKSDPSRVLLVHEQRDTRSPLYVRAALESAAQAALALEPRTLFDLTGVYPAGYGYVILSTSRRCPGPFEEALRNTFARAGSDGRAGSGVAARGRVPLLETRSWSSLRLTRGAAVSGVDWLAPGILHPARQSWEGDKFYQLFGLRTRVTACWRAWPPDAGASGKAGRIGRAWYSPRR
jgi:hypothetical protein